MTVKMVIHNRITEHDVARAQGVTITPTMLAKSFFSGVEACDQFAQKFLNPVLATQMSLSRRETTLLTLYYRTEAYCRSILVLNNAIHFQSVSGATRSVIELYIDVEFIHRNIFSDGPERYDAFTEAQKLRAARKIVQFFSDNPNLESKPSPYDAQRDYIAKNAARIDTQTEHLWGKDSKGRPRTPDHWTDRDLKSRARTLGKDFDLLVNEGYDQRNWAIHTGLALQGLNVAAFTGLCAVSYEAVQKCVLGTLKVLGDELKLQAALTDFAESMAQLERIPAWVLQDEKLQNLGEPGRFGIEIQTA